MASKLRFFVMLGEDSKRLSEEGKIEDILLPVNYSAPRWNGRSMSARGRPLKTKVSCTVLVHMGTDEQLWAS